MPDVTEAGRIFIREGTLLPKTLQIESEPICPAGDRSRTWTGMDSGRKIHVGMEHFLPGLRNEGCCLWYLKEILK